MTGPKQSKTAFVLSLPPTAPAAEVVALARKRGIKLTRPHVHVIRSVAKRDGAKRGPKSNGTSEGALRTAIAELGLTRAREVLAEVERAFR